MREARRHGAVTTAIPVVDSIKRVVDGVVLQSLDRHEPYAIQTPQAFRREALAARHPPAACKAPPRGFSGLRADLGTAPTVEDIDDGRREMWAGFPRDDV